MGVDRITGQLIALGGRLRAARIGMKLNQKDFGALGGVGLTTQQQYEAGKTAPTAEYLFRLGEKGLAVAPLLTGEGTMVVPDQLTVAAIASPELLADLRGELARHREAATTDQEAEDLVEVQEIDLAYGLGSTFSDDRVEVQTHRFPRAWIERITSTPPSMLTFAKGRGDSMQPTIQDGDMVLIDRSQRTVREWDAIWALTVGEMAMIKRVRARGERVHILSDNERVPAEDVFHEEINIVGRVVFIGRMI